MKKILVVSLLSLLVFPFCSRKQEKGTGLEKIPLLVKAEKVKKGSLALYLHYKGTVAAWRTANIVPDASGRIGRILRKQGDPVRQGELLAVVEQTVHPSLLKPRDVLKRLRALHFRTPAESLSMIREDRRAR